MSSSKASTPGKAVSGPDLATAVGLPFLFAIAWLVPVRFWEGFCRLVSPLVISNVTDDPAGVRAGIRQTIGGNSSFPAPGAILRQLAGEHVLSLLHLLRGYRPGGWAPAIRVDGVHHVETALAEGRGAVLWVGYTFGGDLIAKMAFRRSGLTVRHLSRPSHGFSATRFGVRFLNRVQTAIEDRYLESRILLDVDNPGPALAALGAYLDENGVVSITARRDAKRPIRMRFLDGWLNLAPGAPFLSARSGAPLLPVFAYRDRDGGFRVDILPPLTPSPDKPKPDALTEMAADYGPLLDRFVRRHPGQWIGWLHL